MATPMPVSLPPAASTATVFRRAAGAEWTRLWTLRSTWWSILAAAGLMLFVGAAAGSGHTGEALAPVWHAAQFAIVPAQFAFLLAVVLAVTGEHSTGVIRSTLQWVPRRGVLFAARALVPVAFSTACAVVAAVAANVVAWAFLGEAAEVVAGDVAASLGRIAVVVAFGSALAVGFGLVLRSTAGALTTIFLLIFALPVALGNTGVRSLIAVSDSLPGRAIVSLLVVDEVELTATAAATVMIVWTAAALAAGAWSLICRDTT